jgi:hypothetical protein
VDFNRDFDGSSGVCVGPEKDEFGAQSAVSAARQHAFTRFYPITHFNAESYNDSEPHGDDRAYRDRKYGRPYGDN